VSPEVARHLNAAKAEGRTVLAIGTTSTRTLEGRAVQGKTGFELMAGTGEVDLYIHPGAGYTWRFTDAMLTNFHLPESTLLMMISAFIGDLEFTLHAYAVAVRERYRFYSYGDAMLILDR
jgi:S-adenosylmethionine:tRNA ribosyltransferase-isomerase